MNVLVTGATGFIGSHICRALIQNKYETYALSHSRGNELLTSLLNVNSFHLVTGDVRSLSAMQETIERNDIAVIIHAAAFLNVGHPGAIDNQEYVENNVKGTLSVLQASYLAKCPRVVYASTRDVYGIPQYLPIDENHPTKPQSMYGLSKLHGEDYCEFYARSYGVHVAVLRYAGVYGYGKNNGAVFSFIRSAIEGKPFSISSDGNQTRDFVYVGDTVNATIESLSVIDKINFEIFNIGSGREISLNELATKVIEAAGVSSDFAYTQAASNDRFVLDITKARKILDYRPRPLEDTLAEYVRAIKAGG